MDLSNRSDRSDAFQDRELIEAVLQKADDQGRLNESGGSRLSSIIMPSLRSTGTFSRPASIVSKRSVTALSRENLSDVGHDFLDKPDTGQYENIKVNVLILALLCVCSLLLTSLAIQLTLSLASTQATNSTRQTLVQDEETLVSVIEVAAALSTFVVALNVSCLLVCSLQAVIVVKLLKVQAGDERAAKFLRDCSSSRFIAVNGFFVSIPIYLVAVILYITLRFSSAAAVTGTVVLAVGCVFSTVSMLQNFYRWKIERSRAIKGLPVFDSSSPVPGKGKHLSTLV